MTAQSFMFRKRHQSASAYPNPNLPAEARQAIVAAIRDAWREVIPSAGVIKDEDDATALLGSVLNEVRASPIRVPAFNSAVFQMVVRDGPCIGYDGQRLHDRPDLLFRLTDELDENVAWFVECKVVDESHRPGKYRTKGAVRFERGSYAWAMPMAMMVAYAGAAYALPDRLTQIFGSPPEPDPDLEGLWRTTHDRPWKFPGTNRAATPIILTHLWLYGAEFHRGDSDRS